ncbi:MAG: dTDP-glucose 4,6-dehydratase [Ignavibacteriae bacterium]|nr:dTDP-glucose 4,6-dehydratase [Ignavibacteriota bacterium]
MNILITGGAGFIGSNLVRWMLQKHPDNLIVNVDKLTYAGNLENLEDCEQLPNYRFVRGDIADGGLIKSVFQEYRFDVVINCAAESHVDRSIVGSSEFARTNIVGTNVLLELAKEFSLKKFVQVSTDEVYGSLGATGKFTENTPIHPNSPYSASKAAADFLALSYHHTFGIPVVVTRCSNNYGPFQFPEKLIPLMIANAMQDKKLPVYGDGLNVRDWIHVEDHCEAIDTVAQRGKEGELYNVGGNSERANIDVVKLVLRYLGKPESLISFVRDRLGHDRRYAIDSSKIQRDLGWKPRRVFEHGLEETVKWYVSNSGWWKRIISGEYQEYYKKMYEER